VERLSCSIFILDACTLINILHIDEDDMLFNEMQKHKMFIAEEVMNEVKRNAKNKFRLYDTYNVSYEDSEPEEIDEKINILNRYMVKNDIIERDCHDMFDEIKKFAITHKSNGELLSSCLSLLKSREENHLVNFYTDDYPAKNKFKSLFDYQQIGYIHDSVDLLLYLYWSSNKMTLRNLSNFVSSLSYEYSIERKYLLEQIRSRKETIHRLKRDKKIVVLLSKLEHALETLNMGGINLIRDELYLHKRNYGDLIKLLESFSQIFTIENILGSDYFSKIKDTMNWLKKYEILKLN
jgi:hypothetical protein